MEAKAITTSFSNIALITHRKKVIAEERGGLIEYDKRNGICKMHGGIKKDCPYGDDHRERIYCSQK